MDARAVYRAGHPGYRALEGCEVRTDLKVWIALVTLALVFMMIWVDDLYTRIEK